VPAKKIIYASSFAILPLLYVVFYSMHVSHPAQAIEQWLPKWDRVLLIFVIVGLERLYTYRYRVSQRYILGRDIIANIVNLWITGAIVGAIVLPLLYLVPEHLFGRKFVFASPGQLGPFWFQFGAILIFVSLFRYWMHRMQHTIPFLWELHSYHHRVTDLQASNGEVSNPVDYALRNVVVFLVLGVVGFNPLAIVLAVPVAAVTAVFSHCGADIKGGWLNYLFVTPEVHRWHHSSKVPEGRGYSVNYGVEFAFWDIIFGTYYLPHENGETVMPEHIGHPEGLPDEKNYLKILLMPLGLYRPLASLTPRFLGEPQQ
jgi:sterol desaturase/sphingolipid hydroxylase (fatty acid hydroxylase superfamily)